MKMSTKGRYGLRIMMELARQYGKGPIPVDIIAKNQDISGKYIHVLVMGLKAAGLIRTLRGPKGGYSLAREPGSMTALDVVSALEGEIAPVECVKEESYCKHSGSCIARELWCETASAIQESLRRVTIKELAERQFKCKIDTDPRAV